MAVGGEDVVKTGEYDVPLHPMEASAGGDEGIGWGKRDFFNAPTKPVEVGMVAIGETAALFEHRLGNVYRVDAVDEVNEIACDVTGATADIQDGAWLVGDEVREDDKGFGG